MKDVNLIPEFLKKIKQMTNTKIRVGIIGNSNLATIAKANEYGTETEDGKVHIPERSFLRSTFDKKSSIDKSLKFASRLFDRNQKVEEIPHSIGSAMVGEVQTMIDSDISPRNAKSTEDRKGSPHTLIDTGRLRQGITYEVV